MKIFILNGIVLFVILIQAACSVGPDFVKPRPPVTASYSPEGDVKNTGIQHITYAQSQVNTWWDAFHSPQLRDLINLGIQNNYTLQAMQETLEQAKEKVNAEIGQLWPQMSLNANQGRQKYGVSLFGPSNLSIPPYTYYQIGPELNYSLDIFGSRAKSIEKEKAIMTYQHEEWHATWLTLTGNIANAVFRIATLNEEIAASNQIIQEDQKNLALVEKSFRLGFATQAEVLSAKSQKEQDEALLPSLHQQCIVAKDALTLLMGKLPANWQAPDLTLKQFVLPKTLPLTLPSVLVHKRPDILAAEAKLHAASADVGLATANLYPNITLSASMMQEALSPNNLFKASANAWSILGSLTMPIFNGGSLQAERRASIHAYQAAYANFQEVVIKSFTEVNDVLHALRHDEETIEAQKKALASAKTSLNLARFSFEAGSVGILQVLEAERLYTQAKLAYTQALGQRFQDTIQFYLVLGG